MEMQKYLREISTRYTASSIIGLDINKCLSLSMLVIILFTGCILALNRISKMPLNDVASRGIQWHGMEFRIQGRARSTIPRVRRGASSSHESKDNKGLAFKVFWCFEVHAFVACPGMLGPSGAGITRGHRVEVSLKATSPTFPSTDYFVRRLSPPVLTRLPLRFRFFRFDKRKNKVCYSSL